MDVMPLLWLCGPSGVGKSTVGWEVFSQLQACGITAAYVDSDQIGFCRPEPAGDPRNDRLRSRNLAAMLPNFSGAGARCVVASGLLETPTAVETFRTALPDARLAICRLRAEPGTLRERVLARADGWGPRLPGDQELTAGDRRLDDVVENSVAVAEAMERDGTGNYCVDTDGRSVAAVAALVLGRARELHLFDPA